MINTIGRLMELPDAYLCSVNGVVVGYQIPLGLVPEHTLQLKLARFTHVRTARQAGAPTRLFYDHDGFIFEVALYATFVTVRGYDGT